MANYYTELDTYFGDIDEANAICDEQEKKEYTSQYDKNKKAKTGEFINCPVCSKRFRKKSYQQAFCSNKGRGNCKDSYWNFTDEERRKRARLFDA